MSECSRWVTYNPLTATYDTPDGTAVAAELVESVQCMADLLNIAQIRAEQRTDDTAPAAGERNNVALTGPPQAGPVQLHVGHHTRSERT